MYWRPCVHLPEWGMPRLMAVLPSSFGGQKASTVRHEVLWLLLLGASHRPLNLAGICCEGAVVPASTPFIMFCACTPALHGGVMVCSSLRPKDAYMPCYALPSLRQCTTILVLHPRLNSATELSGGATVTYIYPPVLQTILKPLHTLHSPPR